MVRLAGGGAYCVATRQLVKGWVPFLSPNEQHQNTEGNGISNGSRPKIFLYSRKVTLYIYIYTPETYLSNADKV